MSWVTESDCPVCFYIYKKPLYKLSSQQISQQTSGTAYIYTQVVHSNPRQPIAANYKLSWNIAWLFFFCRFFAEAKAVQEITDASFHLSANVLAKHLNTMQYLLTLIHECMYTIRCNSKDHKLQALHPLLVKEGEQEQGWRVRGRLTPGSTFDLPLVKLTYFFLFLTGV